MAGLHRKSIYTKDDNPWCKTCAYCEHIVGEHLFEDGGYICFPKAIPTKEHCPEYAEEMPFQAERRGHKKQ